VSVLQYFNSSKGHNSLKPPSNLSQNKSWICMGSQQTASKESRYPIFVASEQRLDASG